MSGFFSSKFSHSENEDTHIPFYSPEYEQELLSSVGLGESVVPPTVSAMGTPSKFSEFSSTSYLDDPNYFLEFAEPGVEFLPPLDFDFEPYTPTLADVKLEVQETAQPSVRSVRYEPYSESSKDEEPKRKRGRPMKNGSASKMANYSRQYRETKKKELAVSQTRTEKLERENTELREQIKQLTDALQRMESEMSRLRSQQQYVPVAVDQLY